MNHRDPTPRADMDPLDKIDALLRAGQPAVAVPAALDQRIQTALRTPRHSGRPQAARWLAAAAGFALAAAVFHGLPDAPDAAVVSQPVATPEPPPLLVEMENPLRREARALGSDFTRTGRFLIDALPSLEFAAGR